MFKIEWIDGSEDQAAWACAHKEDDPKTIQCLDIDETFGQYLQHLSEKQLLELLRQWRSIPRFKPDSEQRYDL